MRLFNHCLLSFVLTLVGTNCFAAAEMFGYGQTQKSDLGIFPQWLSVLERHISELAPAGDCEQTRFNRCHLRQWLAMLETLRELPTDEQVKRVNQYANDKPYILDIENYGIEDYWATPGQFLEQNGDCEDYAIIKMLSLKKLGFDIAAMRIVVVQDTNLRIPHAVMSLESKGDIMILDNQIKQVISHRDIFHYIPVYSINEESWWMHLPKL